MIKTKVVGSKTTTKILPVSPPPSRFPSDVLKWMKKNAKPLMALKLMQICQFFQHQEFPYLVVKSLSINDRICQVQMLQSNVPTNIDLKNLSKKLWITETLRIFSKDVIMFLLRRVAVCDIKTLDLVCQQLYFDQFKLLIAGGKITTLILANTFITYDNNEGIPLEFVFECLPTLVTLKINRLCNYFLSYQRAARMVPSSFRFLDVRYSHEIFDLEECFNFIRIKPQINFFFYRLGYLASPEYKIRLQSVTNNLLSTWSPKNKPPQIKFEGQTSESKEAIERLEELYNAQKM